MAVCAWCRDSTVSEVVSVVVLVVVLKVVSVVVSDDLFLSARQVIWVCRR